MPLVIPNTFIAATRARAAEVNANFTAVKGKFTESAGGISDADISISADINGATKLSTTAGKRITTASLADDCVTGAILKDDNGGGSPNAAVNLENHIKDGLIPKTKLSTVLGKQISQAQTSIIVVEVFFTLPLVIQFGGILSVSRKIVGANYASEVRGYMHINANGHSEIGIQSVAPPPGSEIPTATRTLLAVYLENVVIAAGAPGSVSGKVVFVSMSSS